MKKGKPDNSREKSATKVIRTKKQKAAPSATSPNMGYHGQDEEKNLNPEE